LAGEVVAECGGNGVGEGEGRDVEEHGACVALGSYQATKCGWRVACHDGFSGPVGVCGGYGVNVCTSHVAFIARGVQNFVEVADCELCSVSLKGRKAIAEV
jgi:hypothetical protein